MTYDRGSYSHRQASPGRQRPQYDDRDRQRRRMDETLAQRVNTSLSQPRSRSRSHGGQAHEALPRVQPSATGQQALPYRHSFQDAFNNVASNSATLKLVNIGDEDKIDNFNNASVIKAKDYWDKHKSSEYDMDLFNHLIGTSAAKTLVSLVYGFYISKGDIINANKAKDWKRNHTPGQLWEMLLSHLPSAVTDINNRDSNLADRLTKFTKDIPWNETAVYEMIGLLNKAIEETGWQDTMFNSEGREYS